MKNQKIRTTCGLACLVFTIFGWGLSFLGTKTLLNNYSPVEIIFFRYLLSYVGLFLIFPKPFLYKGWKFELLCFLAAIFGVSIYQYLENIAIDKTSASNVSIIISCSSFFTAIFTTLILKSEKIGVNFIIGFIFSIVGVILVSFNGAIHFEFNPLGDFLTFGCAILWGLYSVTVSKLNKYNYNIVQVTRRIMLYGVIQIIPIFLICHGQINFSRFIESYNWFWLLFLGILCGTICFMTWNYSVNVLGPVKTSLAMYVQPIVTIIFGAIWFGEEIKLMGVFGALAVIAGLMLSTTKFIDNYIAKKKNKDKEEIPNEKEELEAK